MADLPNEVALTVATPLGMALDTKTDSVQVPSVSGEFGVLPGHLPLLAAVKPGILQYRDGSEVVKVAVGGGYVEAGAERVLLITEFFERAEDVDVEDAQSDLEEAEGRLKNIEGTTDDVAYQEAQRAYDWAQARLTLVGGDSN